MVKGNLFPIGGIVAGGALRTIGTIMRVIRGVTGSTVLRRAFEDSVDMAILTGHSCMLTIKVEGKLRVIHIGGLPTFGRMTTSALVAKLAFVSVILGMAGGTILRRAFEDTVHMTILASHCRMFSIQMECEFGMIHLCILPAFGRVTGRAVGSKLTVVMVILLMAGEASLWSVLQIRELTRVDMTLGTFQRRMFSDQIKWHIVMIKIRTM